MQIDTDDLLPYVKGIYESRGFIRAISPKQSRIFSFSLNSLEMFSCGGDENSPNMNYKDAMEKINCVVARVALIENGIIFCSSKVHMDEMEFYSWNRNILTRLGLYGYGNLPTTRIYGKFYWDRDACPEFFSKIPDDLSTLLYLESPLKFKTTSYPISYARSSPVLSIELPGIDDEVGEKEFWDLYLKKYLGEHNAAVELMMHQYDRFL